MISSWQQRLREHPRAFDAALAVLLFSAAGPGTQLRSTGAQPVVAWWPGELLAVVACGSLLWRRSRPRTVVTVTTGCAMAVCALGYLPTILLLAPLMAALFTLASRTGARTTCLWTGGSVALVVLTSVLAGPASEQLALKTIAPAAWLLLPAALGSVARLQGAWLAVERARAEHAERTREDEARRRVAEERLRIARELHDVVAHHLALANAQANAVARLLPNRPEQAGQLVGQLTETTSAALRELKGTVGLMRQPDEPGAPLAPAPGLAQLPDLAASFASAGLNVDLVAEGEPQALSPGVDLTAYRIVQEALTNVTKHAAAKRARVRLVYGRDRLGITVTDDGPGTATGAAGPGYGLIGMRERAHSVGGRLRTGPRPCGGFEVVTELPLPGPGHVPEEDSAP